MLERRHDHLCQLVWVSDTVLFVASTATDPTSAGGATQSIDLVDTNVAVVVTAEPGGTTLGSLIGTAQGGPVSQQRHSPSRVRKSRCNLTQSR